MARPSSTWKTLKQSADRARGRIAHEEAIGLYTQALECTLGVNCRHDPGAC